MQFDIERIKKREWIEFTEHARIEMEKDDLLAEDLLKAIQNGKMIERYAEDRPFPSCLLFGRSNDKPIHIVCSLPDNIDALIIVTVYIPDPGRWINYERRIE